MNLIPSFSFENSTSLDKAFITIEDHGVYKQDDFCDLATALFAAISSVKYLSLSAHVLYARCLPAFCLTQLRLVLHKCYGWILLAELLKRSPILKCLILKYNGNCDDEYYSSLSSEDEENSENGSNSEDDWEDEETFSDIEFKKEEYSKRRWKTKHHWWNKNEPAPTCLRSHLKTVSISGFKGREDEREVIVFIEEWESFGEDDH